MRSRMAAVMLASGATFLASASGAAAAATASSSTGAPGARAGTTSPTGAALPGVVSQTPVPGTPNVYSGSSCGKNCGTSTVYSTVVVGSEVVVAGSFGRICSPVPAQYAPCPATVHANDIFAYNLGTGAIDPNFTPVIDQGPIYALVAGPKNTVYAGGQFTSVNGASHAGVVRLYVTPGQSTDGRVVPAFTGQLNKTVYALAVNGGALYAGGSFTTVNQSAQTALARLDARTGATDASFQFAVGGKVAKNTTLQVQSMSLTANGSLLAIAGSFQTVNNNAIPRVALIDTGGGLGGAATLANWSAPVLATNCYYSNYIRDIALSPDGSFFVIASTGGMEVSAPSVCDATARFSTAATGNAVQPSWINFSGGDTFDSAVVAGIRGVRRRPQPLGEQRVRQQRGLRVKRGSGRRPGGAGRQHRPGAAMVAPADLARDRRAVADHLPRRAVPRLERRPAPGHGREQHRRCLPQRPGDVPAGVRSHDDARRPHPVRDIQPGQAQRG